MPRRVDRQAADEGERSDAHQVVVAHPDRIASRATRESTRVRDTVRTAPVEVTGEPTRRISGQPGICRETVEAHGRSGMRTLGARIRAEAVAIAQEVLG
ncbi:hypothetical protein Raf01_90020 [Rugosimonospora africana]|uniref:Uncharacterized protein n=1 Tax=Rugosimonospora africana TaxID=556532 RepID=A0A8J3VVY8_9ACTN|nr:hypothetical protein Raf01_90020 [Rugosimonospora africana]